MVAFHAAVVYGLLQHRPVPPPDRRHTVFVTLIAPSESPTPPARKPEPPKPELRKPAPPKPAQPLRRPPDPPRQLAVEALAAPSEVVVPRAEPLPAEPAAPSPESPVEAPPPARSAGPVALSGDLALACPNRPPPAYPVVSRRAGESGRVVLQVEIDVDGRIAAARVRTGSGFQRLDAAALSAVSRWHCNPPLRDGRPVRAVALQPFQFDLE